VLVGGLPMQATYLGPDKLTAQVLVPSSLGGPPVVVRNPGAGGGDSNPDSWSLGPDLDLPTSTWVAGGVAYVLETDLVAVASSSTAELLFIDPAHFVLAPGGLTISAPISSLAAGVKTLVAADRNSAKVFVITNLPSGNVTTVPGIKAGAKVNVDPAANLALVGSDRPNGEVTEIDLATLQTATRSVPGLPCCTLGSVVIDGAFPGTYFLVSDNEATFFPGTRSHTGSQYQVAVDRDAHEVISARGYNNLHVASFASQDQTTSIGLNAPGNLAINTMASGAKLLVQATNGGGGALAFVDWNARQELGRVGSARNRYCVQISKDRGAPDAIAIDPTRNRAFVANSCAHTLEGYNLNILFAK